MINHEEEYVSTLGDVTVERQAQYFAGLLNESEIIYWGSARQIK
jgi:hypothetical protein